MTMTMSSVIVDMKNLNLVLIVVVLSQIDPNFFFKNWAISSFPNWNKV